jgi:hypothetical protein
MKEYLELWKILVLRKEFPIEHALVTRAIKVLKRKLRVSFLISKNPSSI